MSKWWLVVLLAAVATSAQAASSRLMAVAAGDCEEPELQNSARAFSSVMAARFPERVLEAEGAAQRLRPRAGKSHEDIQRQLGVAQTQFFNLQYLKADQQVEDALREIERQPPGPARWSLNVAARLLRGVILLGAKQQKRAEESFRHVLALDPRYQMDVDYYSPSTRAAFEKVRKSLAKASTGTLQVRSSVAGADVYVDGLLMGRAPANLKLVPGRYQVQVMRDGISSFARTVTLEEQAMVHVDLAFEGAIQAGQPLCVSESKKGGAETLSAAVKLGAILNLDELVLVRVRRQAAATQWLTATLVGVASAQEVRMGGLKLEGREADAVSSVGSLVDYVTTGQPTPHVVALDKAQARELLAPAEVARAPEATGVVAPQAITAVGGPPFAGLRKSAWIPAAAGGALLVGGGVFYGLAHGQAQALGSRFPDITDPAATISRGRTLEQVGMGLMIGGAVAAIAGGVMALLDGGAPASAPAPSMAPPPTLTLGAGPEGGFIGVQGHW